MKIESIKKKDLVKLKEEMPKWAKYLAMDVNGDLYWFEEKPVLVSSKKHWRCRVPDAQVKYLGNYMTDGAWFNRVDKILWEVGEFTRVLEGK